MQKVRVGINGFGRIGRQYFFARFRGMVRDAVGF